MKRARSPYRDEKEVMSSHGLLPDRWRVIRKTDFYMYLIDIDGKERRTIGNFKLRKEKPLCR